MRTLVCFATLAIPFAAHAVAATTSKTDPGDPDLAYAFVGMMSGCSAVAIGPHSVLTAGHVGAGDFALGNDVYHLTSTQIAPDWKRNDVDLRLVTVAEELPGWYAVANSVKKGASMTMVGYGATGVVNAVGNAYVPTGGGSRYAGANVISSRETTAGEGPTLRAMLDGPGDSVLMGGDSGGGWFVNGQLVGISAFTFTKSAGKSADGWARTPYFGSGAVDLTNGVLNGWLDGVVATDLASTALDGSPDDDSSGDVGIQATPEPGSLTALTLGAGALLRRRRD